MSKDRIPFAQTDPSHVHAACKKTDKYQRQYKNLNSGLPSIAYASGSMIQLTDSNEFTRKRAFSKDFYCYLHVVVVAYSMQSGARRPHADCASTRMSPGTVMPTPASGYPRSCLRYVSTHVQTNQICLSHVPINKKIGSFTL